MRLILATPLYPPDIAEPAPYVQELARRLSSEHEVSIVTYGRFVEPIPGVKITAVDKRHPLPVRLARYFFALIRATRRADILYMENGPSVELPGVLASLVTGTPLIFHRGDANAREQAGNSTWLRILEGFARMRARVVIDSMPVARAEVIPFLPSPTEQESRYQESWSTHLTEVRTALQYG